MTLIAINILLDPDPATVERGPGHEHSPTQRLSGRFRPRCQPRAPNHPLQRFVRTATGLYDLACKNLALVGIVIEPTEDLIRLQQRMIDAIAPFAVRKGSGGAISQPTVDDANTFVGPRTGMNNHLI